MQTDIGLVIAIVGTGIAIVGAVLAMMFWSRSEANNVRMELKEDRKDMLQISRNIEITVQAIQNEMKDFHHQLLNIKKKNG